MVRENHTVQLHIGGDLSVFNRLHALYHDHSRPITSEPFDIRPRQCWVELAIDVVR